MSDLFTLMRKTQEAQAIRLGVEIERQFTDDELAGSMELLAEAEAEIYGTGPITFRVTITTASGVRRLDVLATDACMANIRAAEIMFQADKPMAFKIKVEPINVAQLKEAA